jgi:glycosyltransferase involved in cell wall biosynthesis
MKKILYIGHSFHQKTLSTQFFIDILEKNYEVEFIWTLPKDVSKFIRDEHIEHRDYFAIIIFQTILPVEELNRFKTRNIILIPMYDNDIFMPYAHWAMYHRYKFINFSKSLYNKLSFLGIENNLYLQYAPKLESCTNSTENKEKVKIFFWQRDVDLNWELIKKVINPDQIDSIHMHRIESDANKDLWFTKPNHEDVEKFNMTFSSWFESKNELIEKLKDCDIFIAPRFYEGIGQAFIEAMGYGKCVIAPDLPTMNEYIIHNVNGLLFNPRLPEVLDLTDWAILAKNAKKTIDNIQNVWDKKKNDIIEFIEFPIKHVDDNSMLEENIKHSEVLLSGSNLEFLLDDFKLLYKEQTKTSMLFSAYLGKIYAYLRELEKDNNELVLYGTGSGAEFILSVIPDLIVYIIDKSPEKEGMTLLSKPIYSINKLHEDKNKILNSVFGRINDVIVTLEKNDIDAYRLISLDLY